MRPVHVATPKLDGRKTECIHCYNKTAFGKESCEEHKSDWISNTQTPKWNKRITTVLDAGAAECVIAIYSSGSRGKAHDLIGWYERIFMRARRSLVSCRPCPNSWIGRHTEWATALVLPPGLLITSCHPPQVPCSHPRVSLQERGSALVPAHARRRDTSQGQGLRRAIPYPFSTTGRSVCPCMQCLL